MNQVKSGKDKGRLILVPTPLGSGTRDDLPARNLQLVETCRHFVVESLKMGRRHLRMMIPGLDLDQCHIFELSEERDQKQLLEWMQIVLEGHNICLMSDAGNPAMADPGQDLVSMAHALGIPVVPLAGPSSVLMALIASGLNGQKYTFHGYLHRDKYQLRYELKALEREAKKGFTQIFMETPYRNQAMLEMILRTLDPSIMLCLACSISQPDEYIRTKFIAQWKSEPLPNLHKRPCIFLLGSDQNP